MDLDTPIGALVGVGPGTVYRLSTLGVNTVWDLINHYPFRYEDFSNTVSTLEAKVGEKVTLQGEIWSIKNIFTRTGKVLTEAIFNDGTAPIKLTWFNQSWLTKQLFAGDKVQVAGKVSKYKNKLSIMAPVWEKIIGDRVQGTGDSLHTGRLVPVYPETEGITSKWFRTKIALILPKIKDQVLDPLPDEIRNGMFDLTHALEQIHFPENYETVQKATQRLGFDELFYIQLATQKARLNWQKKSLIEPLQVENWKLEIENFIEALPFELTKAQLRVVDEILKDLGKITPMNRFVQGEVGSGKTVVAAIVAYLVHLNGLKTLYMAPTEILAFQHHKTLSSLLEPLGIKVGIYTGSRKFTENVILEGVKRPIESMDKDPIASLQDDRLPEIIVGTHALLSESLQMEDVGLIIIDEQQRFGVEQRTLLRSKAKVPHFLTMTATPIPRTVALTLYGDLDLSVIDELPKGRQIVKTFYVPNFKRDDSYQFIRKKISEGDQVYIITPLIEESETLTSKAAITEYNRLSSEIFPDLSMGLLHGRLKSKEKEEVLNKFKEGDIKILVSTTVVEVGVDVPNATIMVIEGAERFGLAQLHQLRGRVGRGQKESFCFLFSDDKEAAPRLKNLESIHDGMKLAELDLKIRGSGEIFGVKQSGRWNLKIADLSDISLVERTRASAQQLLSSDPELSNYPQLKEKINQLTSEVAPD